MGFSENGPCSTTTESELWNSSRASSFLSWSRCFASARVLQWSRSFIEALFLSVALTKKLSHSGYFLSPRATTEPSGVAGGALTSRKGTVLDKREAASGLRCGGGGLIVPARRVAAHLGDFLLRLRFQFCRERCCSSYLLRHSARPLLVYLLSTRSVPDTSPTLERRRAQRRS